MSGAERVGNRPLVPEATPGAERTARGRVRREGEGFDGRLAESRALVPVEPRREVSEREARATAALVSDEEWLRARTLEELKTLVQAIQTGVTDPWQLTDLIFYARHPEMKGVALTHEHQELLDEWNQISALLVHPALNEVSDFLGVNVRGGALDGPEQFQTAFERATRSPANTARLPGGNVHRFDDVIARAVEWCPGLSPAILKGLLAQESNFDTDVVNRWGYAGIAQFGRAAAREVGLQVGVAGSAADERLNPFKAIPAAARLLSLKAQRLGEIAFARYGQPSGVEFWKFVLAAYNGGEGTVALAMGHAYREGLAAARAKGLVGTHAVSFARNYASKWENLRAGGLDSPLGRAAARYFPSLAEMKYHEIGNYPTAIVARASAGRARV
ncbi:MAG TPA: transglycosylase SLT domain-containing protein [Pyrinomonadaceae bacterium]|nr:transglycosylase SLT domain-containing protein [Pyrinomonadaceae bacterium]